MGNMSEADVLLRQAAGYLKPEDLAQLESAYRFSAQAHDGQFRKSGEPYVSHPLAVAEILTQWHLDPQALTAALLHDVMEDTAVTKAEIAEKFGKMVADLVDGVSKLDRIEFESQEHEQAENFRKMLLAMTRDVRVILIKLADRLHNMRTLDVMQPKKRARIARETIDIYAPIANRLGLNGLFQELQELSFRHLFPTRYKVLQKAVNSARGNRREVVNRILEAIRSRLEESGIAAAVSGREKNLYSIYHKMQEKHLTFSQVSDIFGFRVIVKDVPACYWTMGALHGLYKPIPGKFKDYIAIPKTNGYQSLHTTLFGPFGMPIEVQIRTQEMHKLAEAGVASHWLYKASDTELSDLQQKTHQWLQSLLEMQTQSGSSIEFLEHLKVDLFPDAVYVFTPKGKILSMPQGSTCVDFAYAVHTDIGNRCISARINNELVPLRTVLRNGDRVEIITAAHALAQLRGHGQGAVPHPALPQDHAVRRVRAAGRASAEPGAVRSADPPGAGARRQLGQAAEGWQPPLQAGGARRDRPGQAAGLRGREAPAATGRLRSGSLGASARLHGHPRLRRSGAAAREMLPPDSGRSDHRLHPQGPRSHRPHARLSGRPQDARGSRQVARHRMVFGHRPPVRSEHQAGGVQSAGRAGATGRGNRGGRRQHRQRQPRTGRLQRLRQHPFHAAGEEPPASGAHHAWPAAHPRGDPHHPPEGMTHTAALPPGGRIQDCQPTPDAFAARPLATARLIRTRPD
jgi:ppGpp synthetase/RelA/SpoT-type nucleotidyltranferase